MYSSLAQLGLVLSILLGILSPLGLIWIRLIGKKYFSKILNNILLLQFVFISFAFISLLYAYVVSDFSIYNVYKNSHQAVPLIFKISGMWSNHEGSMLLWLFLLSLVNFISTFHKLKTTNKIWLSSSQILITSTLLIYTILKSNPLIKLIPAAVHGSGFNPVLQDLALAIHPPVLYLGYVASVIPFSASISALLEKNLSIELLEIIQKWTLFSWSFITLGVSLGSWWAYRELGWGGYWFWDPVENASILPWIASIALIHYIYSTKKLSTNYRSTVLLAIFTFLLSIFTTFLVRSGMVVSVHSFATDPARGTFILILLFAYSLFSLSLFAINGTKIAQKIDTSWLSRFGGINLSNIFWAIAIFIILLSLIYPLLLENYTGEKITIEKSFFEKTLIPLLLPILLLLALTLPSTWQKILPIHYKHFIYSTLWATGLSLVFYKLSNNIPSLVCLLFFFAGTLVIARMLFWLYLRMSTPITLKFLLIWGIHIVAGILTVNMTIIETNSKEILLNMQQGDKVHFADFDIIYQKRESLAYKNYLIGRVHLNIEKEGINLAVLEPEIRYYPVEKSQTSETSIYHGIFYDLYAVISEITKDANVVIKLYYKPMISWLWITSGVAFACGILLLLPSKKKNHAPA